MTGQLIVLKTLGERKKTATPVGTTQGPGPKVGSTIGGAGVGANKQTSTVGKPSAARSALANNNNRRREAGPAPAIGGGSVANTPLGTGPRVLSIEARSPPQPTREPGKAVLYNVQPKSPETKSPRGSKDFTAAESASIQTAITTTTTITATPSAAPLTNFPPKRPVSLANNSFYPPSTSPALGSFAASQAASSSALVLDYKA